MSQLRHLRRLVRSRLGVPQTDQLFTDDQLDDHINLAIQTVEAEQRWPWQEQMETVTVDPEHPEIELGPTWRATRSLYYVADNRATVELSLVAPSELLGFSGISGIPEVWAPIGSCILVRPEPASTVSLFHYYYTQPEWLRSDDALPNIPDQFNGAIVAKAAELLSIREDDRGAAAGHSADYERWIDRMRRDVRRSTNPVNIRVRSGSWLE